MTDPQTDADPLAPNRDDDDPRSDLQQAVEARADALARGEGGPEPEPFTETGDYSGNAGTGGEVKNQDADAQ